MSEDLRSVLEALLEREDLSQSRARRLLQSLAGGEVPPAQAGGLLCALRAKGETAAEIRGFAQAMRELAVKPSLSGADAILDVVGTGGDASGSLNLSTGVALLTAAAGVPVVKHGNRSISSHSGSADVLEALGLPVPLTEQQVAECLATTNFTFLFAPRYHPAMKAIAPVRQALGVRTVFNILGPLCNPAAPRFNVIGAYSTDTARLMAETLSGMDTERSFVVHGALGWDEATPVGPFDLFDVRAGTVEHRRVEPRDFGVARCTGGDLAGGDAAYNARALEDVLLGRDRGAHRDALLLGTALALQVTGRAADLQAGLTGAERAIDSGAAARVLAGLREVGAADA